MKYTRSITPVLALALVAGACSTKERNADSLAVDSSLNRDLELANRDSAAQPQLRDVPSGTGTARTGTTAGTAAPRSAPTRSTAGTSTRTSTTRSPSRTSSGNTVSSGSTGSGGAVGSLPSGTSISATSNAKVCTNTNQVGNTFTATVGSTITAGGVRVPAGSTVRLEVTSLKRSENANDPIQMAFRVQSVTINGTNYPLDGSVSVAQSEIVRDRNQPKSKDAQKVAAGAAIGAVAGQILGKDTRSTVIGAAAGAAAGTAAAVATANYEGCLPLGGNLTVTTTSPTQIRVM